MSHSQFHGVELFTLRHAWLNPWDKHMTTGRINQVTKKKSLKKNFFFRVIGFFFFFLSLFPSFFPHFPLPSFWGGEEKVGGKKKGWEKEEKKSFPTCSSLLTGKGLFFSKLKTEKCFFYFFVFNSGKDFFLFFF